MSNNQDFKVKSEVLLDRPQPWSKLSEEYSGGSIFLQIISWLAFWVLTVVQFVMLCTVYASENMHDDFDYRSYNCTNGGSDFYYFGHKLSDGLRDDVCACRLANGERRLSTSESMPTMFDILSDYVYIPIVGSLMVLTLAFIWLICLKQFGQTFIWISMFLNIAMMVLMAVLLFTYEATGAAVVIVVFASLFALYCMCRKEMINRAGKTLEVAARGLWKNVSIFVLLTPIECVFLGYIFFWMFGWAQASKVGKVTYSATEGCDVALDDSQQSKMWFSSFLMLWITFYFNHVKVNVVGATIAAWAFGQKDDGSWDVSTQALKWSFWHSSPTLSLTSLICTCIERLKRIVENKCNWANPACCALMLIGYCLFSIMQAFGRFSVVLHSITGKPFYESAYHSFRLLVKGGNIEHALSADYFIGMSLNLVSYILSLGVGMMMWAWADDVTNLTTLDPNEEDWQAWFWVLFVLMVILNKWPYWSIFVISIIGGSQWLANETNGRSSNVLIAMFTAAVSHIIFAYFAAIVLDSVDTIVMCYAIDKDNGLVSSDYSKKDEVVATLYVQIDDLVAKHGGGDGAKMADMSDASDKA